MATIKKLIAEEVLSSKGYGGVETTAILSNGIIASSSPPSGTSKGTYEAHEIRDAGSKHYGGFGVLKAVENVNKIIAPNLLGVDINNQQKIDKLMIELDGTKDKSKLGIVIEFKKVDSYDSEDLEKAAEVAINQIKEKDYKRELSALGIEKVVELGIAFEGKKVLVRESKE